MRGRAWLVLAALAAVVAWIRLAGVSPAARLWTVLLLIAVPAAMIMQGRALDQIESLPRPAAYNSSIISLWSLAVVTGLVAWRSGYGPAALGLIDVGVTRTIVFASLLTIAAIGILFLFRFLGVREPDIVHQLMPVTRSERALFVGLSLSAGICEEIVFRGFLVHVLYGTTGSMAIALLLANGAFGVSHAYQQPAGALRATLLGLLLSIPLVLDGSIVPAIIAHAAVDIVSGLWLSRVLLRG